MAASLASSAASLLSVARSTTDLDIPYKQSFPFAQRQAEAQRIREKFPGRVPVIVEKAPRSDVSIIDKKKFLVPADLTIGHFIFVVRKRLSLPPEKILY